MEDILQDCTTYDSLRTQYIDTQQSITDQISNIVQKSPTLQPPSTLLLAQQAPEEIVDRHSSPSEAIPAKPQPSKYAHLNFAAGPDDPMYNSDFLVSSTSALDHFSLEEVSTHEEVQHNPTEVRPANPLSKIPTHIHVPQPASNPHQQPPPSSIRPLNQPTIPTAHIS